MLQYSHSQYGWHRDLPDPRDYDVSHPEVKPLLRPIIRQAKLPTQVDLRDFFPPVENQQSLRACTSFACVGLLQYFERRATGRVIEPSKLFVYQVTRRLLGWTGDCGAQLRATWKTIRQFGIPDERFWAYDPREVEREPDAFVYAAARRYRSIRFVRLDPGGKSGRKVLARAMELLAGGLPFVLGFPVANTQSRSPEIHAPTVFDGIRGGQAAIAVGYDVEHRFRSHTGAFLIRNSWGGDWGDNGYGWLPFDFVASRLAADLWGLIEPTWMASGEFGCR